MGLFNFLKKKKGNKGSYSFAPHKNRYINHCWKCHSPIDSNVNKLCPKCGKHYICDNCGMCYCDRPSESQSAPRTVYNGKQINETDSIRKGKGKDEKIEALIQRWRENLPDTKSPHCDHYYEIFNDVLFDLTDGDQFYEDPSNTLFSAAVDHVYWDEDSYTTHLSFPAKDIIGSCCCQKNNIITHVYIPATVKKIGGSAFEDCGSLADVSLSEGLQVISYNAFKGCRSLKIINIPSTIWVIRRDAFKGCINLEVIAFNDTMRKWRKVRLESGWNSESGTKEIRCTNGTIVLQPNSNI